MEPLIIEEDPARAAEAPESFDFYQLYESVVGEVVVLFGSHGVSRVALSDDWGAGRLGGGGSRELVRSEPPVAWGRHVYAALRGKAGGRVPVDLRERSPLQRAVLRVVGSIPRGETRSYSWVAGEAGWPRAVRAVASAVAQNPVPLIIPCHRVIRASGELGEYSLGGPSYKAKLLAQEGAVVSDRERQVDPRRQSVERLTDAPGDHRGRGRRRG